MVRQYLIHQDKSRVEQTNASDVVRISIMKQETGMKQTFKMIIEIFSGPIS